MKICPTCGTTASEADAFCPLDGNALVAGSTANTVPARRGSGAWCMSCGSRDGQDVAGTCLRCGSRAGGARSLAPAAPGSKVGDFTVVRAHGDGDVCVADGTGATRLLVFGPKERVAEEASALGAAEEGFASVVLESHSPEVGHFALLTYEVAGAVPLLEAELSLTGGFELVERVLDAAAKLEARGFAWEPAPTDLYLRGSDLLVVRARGARKLAGGERSDAKRVMEALAGALLPEPFSRTNPEVIRLLLPRWNFTTVTARSTLEVRDDMKRARALVAETPTSGAAELSDPGLRRPHHEDATAVTEGEVSGEPCAVLVVCDGVSSSARAGEASVIAARVACDRLTTFLRQRSDPPHAAHLSLAVSEAIGEAHQAICDARLAHGAGAPPGTTIALAVVIGRALTVGWVGDSRVYWISETGSELCTTDHSWVNDEIARGSLTEAEAMSSPFAHALTRCLGPLEGGGADGSRADVRTRALPGPGCVVVCTDGLWNYFPGAEAIASLVADAGPGADARTIARYLVCRALAEGGGDNVSIAVHRVV